MRNQLEYKVAPLQCWGKLDEIRHAHFKNIWDAQKNGNILIMGVIQPFQSLFSGFGDFASMSYSPYFTGLMRDRNKLINAFEALEAKGFGNYMCANLRCQLGQMYQGITLTSLSGKTIRPDFIFDFAWCPDSARAAQVASEYLGIPHLILDVPYYDSQHCLDYLTEQMENALEWMEQVTGKKIDDDKFINGVKNEWQVNNLWARICELNKTIPAPLDMRHMGRLRLPASTSSTKKECVEFYKMVYDEVKWRVENHISARGIEKSRLLLDPQWPFVYNRDIYREAERYGAVLIGGRLNFSSFGSWEVDDNGIRNVVKTPAERGIDINNRKEALKAIADSNLKYYLTHKYYDLSNLANEYIHIVEDYHANGAIFHFDRGCRGYLTMGQPEIMLALEGKGIPCTSFDGSMCDIREYSEQDIIDRIDEFMDRLGLTKLEILKEKGMN